MSGIELYAPRGPRHRRTWTVAAIVLMVAFFVAGQLLSIFGIERPLGYHSADLETQWRPVAIMLAGFGFTALLVLAWARLFERRPPAALGLNGKAVSRYVRGLFAGFGCLAAVVGLAWAFGVYRIEAPGVWAAPTPALFIPILCLFAGYMIQGATEEIMFRGWILQLVASRHGLVIGVLLNAVVFAAMHAGNVPPSKALALGLVNVILFAVLLSLYAIREGSLWGVCAWHTAWNTLLGAGFGLDVSGSRIAVQSLVVDLAPAPGAPWWLTGGTFGPEASVATTAVLLTGCLVLLARRRAAPVVA